MFAQLINRINRTEPSDDDAEGFAPTIISPLFGAEAVTPEQRQLIELAIDCVDDPLVFYDRHLLIQFANAAYARRLGRDRAALIGESIDAAPRDVLGDAPRATAERALDGETVDVEISGRDTGSPVGLHRVRLRPHLAANGTLVGVLCSLHRVESARAHGALAAPQPDAPDRNSDGLEVSAPLRAALRIARDDVVERERKQRELIESLPLPLVFIGKDGLCKWGNPAFGSAFGLAEHEVGGVVGPACPARRRVKASRWPLRASRSASSSN